MTVAPEHIKVSRSKKAAYYLNPLNWFKRATYSNIGPLKNPDFWSGTLFNFNKAKVSVTEKTAQSIPAYFRAVTIIAEQIASLPIGVYRRDGENLNETTSHPLHKLLKFRPNPLQSRFDFFETIIRQWMVRGESFVRIKRSGNGSVSELEILPRCADIFENNGQWWYKFDGKGIFDHTEILHFKAYSMDGVRGKSPLDYFSETIGRAIAEIEFGASYYGNGAHLSGLLIPEKPMTKEQSQQLVKTFNAGQSGPEKVGKTGYVPFGVRYEKLSANMLESDYLNARRLTVEDISNITGVHPILLSNLDKATFSNVEELNRTFVQYTLRSWVKRFENEINSKIFSDRELGNIFVSFNLDGLMRGDTEARAKFYTALFNTRAINPNEIRKMENMNPYEGGDEYGLPLASNTKEEPKKVEA